MTGPCAETLLGRSELPGQSAASRLPGARQLAHWAASLSEGLCPDCRAEVQPLHWLVPDDRRLYRCWPCGKFWGASLRSGRHGWWRAGATILSVPEWMTWTEDPG